jgi:hypothetical protein
MLTERGFPRRMAEQGLLRMARQTLDNIEAHGTQGAWTGPVARGDYGTVARQFAALRGFPEEFGAAHAALLSLGARALAPQPVPVLKKLKQVFEESRGARRVTAGSAISKRAGSTS